MSESNKKRVNKTKGELVTEMVNKATAEAQEKRKALIKERMTALHELEDRLGCLFVPMIQHHNTGSQTYIAAIDAPKEETKEEGVV